MAYNIHVRSGAHGHEREDKGITLRVTYTSAHNTRYLHYLAKRRGPVLVTPLRIGDESRAMAIARLSHRLRGKIVRRRSYPLNRDRPANDFFS